MRDASNALGVVERVGMVVVLVGVGRGGKDTHSSCKYPLCT